MGESECLWTAIQTLETVGGKPQKREETVGGKPQKREETGICPEQTCKTGSSRTGKISVTIGGNIG